MVSRTLPQKSIIQPRLRPPRSLTAVLHMWFVDNTDARLSPLLHPKFYSQRYATATIPQTSEMITLRLLLPTSISGPAPQQLAPHPRKKNRRQQRSKASSTCFRLTEPLTPLWQTKSSSMQIRKPRNCTLLASCITRASFAPPLNKESETEKRT